MEGEGTEFAGESGTLGSSATELTSTSISTGGVGGGGMAAVTYLGIKH